MPFSVRAETAYRPFQSIDQQFDETDEAYLQRIAAEQPELFEYATMNAVTSALNGVFDENTPLEKQIVAEIDNALTQARINTLSPPAHGDGSFADDGSYNWQSSTFDSSGNITGGWELSATPNGDPAVFEEAFESRLEQRFESASEEAPVVSFDMVQPQPFDPFVNQPFDAPGVDSAPSIGSEQAETPARAPQHTNQPAPTEGPTTSNAAAVLTSEMVTTLAAPPESGDSAENETQPSTVVQATEAPTTPSLSPQAIAFGIPGTKLFEIEDHDVNLDGLPDIMYVTDQELGWVQNNGGSWSRNPIISASSAANSFGLGTASSRFHAGDFGEFYSGGTDAVLGLLATESNGANISILIYMDNPSNGSSWTPYQIDHQVVNTEQVGEIVGFYDISVGDLFSSSANSDFAVALSRRRTAFAEDYYLTVDAYITPASPSSFPWAKSADVFAPTNVPTPMFAGSLFSQQFDQFGQEIWLPEIEVMKYVQDDDFSNDIALINHRYTTHITNSGGSFHTDERHIFGTANIPEYAYTHLEIMSYNGDVYPDFGAFGYDINAAQPTIFGVGNNGKYADQVVGDDYRIWSGKQYVGGLNQYNAPERIGGNYLSYNNVPQPAYGAMGDLYSSCLNTNNLFSPAFNQLNIYQNNYYLFGDSDVIFDDYSTTAPAGIHMADMDADGDIDIFTTSGVSSGSGGVQYYQNQTAQSSLAGAPTFSAEITTEFDNIYIPLSGITPGQPSDYQQDESGLVKGLYNINVTGSVNDDVNRAACRLTMDRLTLKFTDAAGNPLDSTTWTNVRNALESVEIYYSADDATTSPNYLISQLPFTQVGSSPELTMNPEQFLLNSSSGEFSTLVEPTLTTQDGTTPNFKQFHVALRVKTGESPPDFSVVIQTAATETRIKEEGRDVAFTLDVDQTPVPVTFEVSPWQDIPGLDGVVNALATGTDGTLYAGGAFSGFASSYDVNSESWNILSGLGSAPNALHVSENGTLYVGGAFGVATWNGFWSPVSVGGTVHAITSDGSTIYVGGEDLGGSFVKSSTDGTTWTAVGSGGPANTVYALAVFDGDLYAGGAFFPDYLLRWGRHELDVSARCGLWQPE